jgi:hypothetical protein
VQHVGQVASFGFFGLSLWLTARMLQRRTLLSGAAAGLSAGFMVLEPDQVALLGAYVLVGMVAAHWLASGWAGLRASLPALAAATAAGLALIALPLLWTWLFAGATTRPEVDLVEAGRGSLHPASLLTGFIADLFGARDPRVDFWGPYSPAFGRNDLYLSQNMGQVYVGALPLLLLIVPGMTRGWLWDQAIRPFTLLFVFMVVFALGRYTPAFELFYEYLPGVKQFRRPADATFLIGGLGAILCGYLLHRLIAARETLDLGRDMAVAALALALAFSLALAVSQRVGRLGDAWAPAAWAALWLVLSGAALVAIRRWRGTAGGLAALAVAILVAGDLAANNGPNESTALPPEIYDVLRPDTGNETVTVLKRLTAQPEGSPRRDRVELLGLGFEWPNAGMIHGFDHTLGYNPLRLAEFSDAVGTQDGIAGPDQRKFTALFPGYRCRLANLLGLRYIASPVPIGRVDRSLRDADLRLVARTKDGYIYENPRALPRVMFVGGWQFADFDSMKLTGRWPEADPQATVLLEQEPPVAVREGGAHVDAQVKLVRYANTEVEIEVTAPKTGFIVLNDIWHPWWRAQIDGVDTEILKANVLFRAVQVPAGTHRIRFEFRPLEGAIAELREKAEPPEPEGVPTRPLDEPLIVRAPSRGVSEALGLVPPTGAARGPMAASQVF